MLYSQKYYVLYVYIHPPTITSIMCLCMFVPTKVYGLIFLHTNTYDSRYVDIIDQMSSMQPASALPLPKSKQRLARIRICIESSLPCVK